MIYRSPEPDIEIPDVTLTEYVIGGAAARGDHPAFIDGASGQVTTYGDLAAKIDAVAALLQSRGIVKGSVVGLVGPNSAEWGIAYHAILRAGAIVTPMNPLLMEKEVARQVQDSGAGLVIDDAESLVGEAVLGHGAGGGRGGSRRPRRPALLERHHGNDEGGDAHPSQPGGEHRAGLELDADRGGRRPGRAAALTSTSTARRWCSTWAWPRARRSSTCRASTSSSCWTSSRATGSTWLHVAPPVILAIATAPQVEGRDFSKLKLVISGAAPLDADLAGRAEERIGAPIRQGYGMTELSPVSHKSRLARVEETPPGSVGALVPNTEARLVDPETATDVDEGEEGEIWVRGPQVMKGYLNNPAATSETLAADGWLRTGDIGRVDENGFFFIVDRLKELIKYKGYQVPPAELEAVLVSHPKVKDAGVIGMHTEEGEEAPMGCVVIEGDVDADELLEYVAERVAPYKKLRRIEFVEEVPKSASGKILRRLLREQHGDAKISAS